MSTHNIGFYEDLTKIISELSSNIIKYHQICTLFLLLDYVAEQANVSRTLCKSYIV